MFKVTINSTDSMKLGDIREMVGSWFRVARLRVDRVSFDGKENTYSVTVWEK